jgi:hypothetical protein
MGGIGGGGGTSIGAGLSGPGGKLQRLAAMTRMISKAGTHRYIEFDRLRSSITPPKPRAGGMTSLVITPAIP